MPEKLQAFGHPEARRRHDHASRPVLDRKTVSFTLMGGCRHPSCSTVDENGERKKQLE
jgi:hypothetical protein